MPTTQSNIACQVVVAFAINGAVASPEFVFARASDIVHQLSGAISIDDQAIWDEIERIAPPDDILRAYARSHRTPPL